jgi:hypothetical protein
MLPAASPFSVEREYRGGGTGSCLGQVEEDMAPVSSADTVVLTELSLQVGPLFGRNSVVCTELPVNNPHIFRRL